MLEKQEIAFWPKRQLAIFFASNILFNLALPYHATSCHALPSHASPGRDFHILTFLLS